MDWTPSGEGNSISDTSGQAEVRMPATSLPPLKHVTFEMPNLIQEGSNLMLK
jgi:hypothetical protein